MKTYKVSALFEIGLVIYTYGLIIAWGNIIHYFPGLGFGIFTAIIGFAIMYITHRAINKKQ